MSSFPCCTLSQLRDLQYFTVSPHCQRHTLSSANISTPICYISCQPSCPMARTAAMEQLTYSCQPSCLKARRAVMEQLDCQQHFHTYCNISCQLSAALWLKKSIMEQLGLALLIEFQCIQYLLYQLSALLSYG